MPYVRQKLPIVRILQIVKRLYALEKLQSSNLAKEYEVSSRTIHRDMSKILEIIPLQNKQGIWSLDTRALTSSNNTFPQALLSAFAHNIEIEVTCLEKKNITKEKVVFAIEYKHLPKKLGEQIVKCIEEEERCTFKYEKPEGTSFREVDAIKIYTENGRWYVIAKDYKDNRVKYFNLAKITNFKQLKDIPQTITPDILRAADEIKSIWSSIDKKGELVRLYVKSEIVNYIRDIKLHKSQIIYDEHYDGGIEVHCTITHKLEILPQIKSWLPSIHILEPKWLHNELMKDLEIYREEDWKMDI